MGPQEAECWAGALLGLLLLAAWLRRRGGGTDGSREDGGSWWRERAVVVTGCDSGLGFTLAHWCHDRGMVVVAACHEAHSSAGADQLQRTGRESGRLVVVRQFDVTRLDCVERLGDTVASVVRDSGTRLHCVVNNAASLVLARLEWQTPAMLQSQIQVNLTGPALVTRQLLGQLRASRGSRVINLSSPCAHTRLPLSAVYAASKAGLEAMTEALQLEVAEDGVHLLSLDPGTSLFLRTSMGARQAGHYQTMENNVVTHKTEAFETTKTILSHVKGPELQIIQDDNIMGTFRRALCSDSPMTRYSCSTWMERLTELAVVCSPKYVADRIKRRIVQIL